MFDFLKICGKGLVYTLLLPFFILIFVFYLIISTFFLIYNIGKGIIIYFKGENLSKMLFEEDKLAQKIMEERKNSSQQNTAQIIDNNLSENVSKKPSLQQPLNDEQSQPINTQNFSYPADDSLNVEDNEPINKIDDSNDSNTSEPEESIAQDKNENVGDDND